MKRILAVLLTLATVLAARPAVGETDLINIMAKFMRIQSGRVYGFDFSGLSTDSSWAGEFKGRYGHPLTDTLGGWVLPPGPVTVGSEKSGSFTVASLTTGVLYPVYAGGAGVTIQLSAAPAAGEYYLFLITDDTNSVTIDVAVGAGTDYSLWAVDKVFPAARSKGQFFALYAANNHAGAPKFAISYVPENFAVNGTCYVGGQADFVSNLDASGGVDVDADHQYVKWGAGADFTATYNGTNMVFLQSNDAGLGAGNVHFTSADADGQFLFELGTNTNATSFEIEDALSSTLFQVGGAGQADIPGNLDVTGGVDIDADNARLSIGAGADVTCYHDGTNSTCESITGDLIFNNLNVNEETVLRVGTATNTTGVEIQDAATSVLFSVTGDGQATFNGNVDAKNGLDVTMANLRMGAGLIIQGLGALTLNNATAAVEAVGYALAAVAGAGGASVGLGAGGNGGQLTLGAGAGGDGATLPAAQNGGTGGNAGLSGGAGGASGDDAASTAGPGGDVTVAAGGAGGVVGAGAGNNGGHTYIRGGNASGGGADGNVVLGDSNTTAVRALVSLDAEAGLDVTGANLTMAGNLSINGDGALDIDIDPAPATFGGYLFRLLGGAGGEATATAIGGNGGAVTMQAGTGGAGDPNPQNAGDGGVLSLYGGRGGAAALLGGGAPGAGGAVNIWAGGGGTIGAGVGAVGGNISIRAGNATGALADGTIQIGDANTSAVGIGAAGILTTVTGNFTYTGHKLAQSMVFNAGQCTSFAGGTPDWVPQATGSWYCAPNEANAMLVIHIEGLKVGDVIQSWRIIGSIEASVGNAVTLAASLRRNLHAASVPVDGEIDAHTGWAGVTADVDLYDNSEAAVSTVATGYQYYARFDCTTGAAAWVHITGIELVIDRK